MRALVVALLLAAAAPAWADQFVVDVSERTVAITAGFTGAELVVFGTAAQAQGSTAEEHGVIVVVRGPEQPTVVRRKERNFGIWANHGGVAFPEAPAFVWVAASEAFADRPMQEILNRYKLGQDFLAAAPADADVEELDLFQAALVRRKQVNGLYSAEFGHVEFLGEHLFRTRVAFPANVPVGSYRIEVFEVRGANLVNITASALHVRKAGLEAAVFRFAHDFPILHGLVAILLALMAGWFAGAVARRT